MVEEPGEMSPAAEQALGTSRPLPPVPPPAAPAEPAPQDQDKGKDKDKETPPPSPDTPGTQSEGSRSESSHREGEEEDKDKQASQAAVVACSSFAANPTAAARRLKAENDRLQAELTRLRRLVISAAANAKTDDQAPGTSAPANSLEVELQVAREALVALRADRKRLKAEKFELLNQMKQLYATLEDKEKELRDFIRNYEQRVRESDASLQQLSTEREERERERWSLLRHARDEAERSLSLAAQLNAKELQLRQAHEQLRDARRQMQGCLSDGEGGGGRGGLVTTPGSLAPGDRGSCSADSGVVRDRAETASSIGGNLSDSTTDGAPTITIEGSNVDVDSISVVSSVAPPHLYQLSTPKDCSPTLSPLNANAFSRSIDAGILSRSVEQLSSPLGEGEPLPAVGRRKAPSATRGRGGTWGSISRVFARSRHRNKAAAVAGAADGGEDAAYRSWSPLTEEGYAEKLRLLREAAAVPMERWRAPTVLAWLEIALGMPQYGPRCAENVKSGKLRALNGQVLLELSDLELECGLGISHPMHRKKLRLAIEEHRHPSLVRYPCIAQLGHTWVSSEWLPDLGLAQYSDSFAANMVDPFFLAVVELRYWNHLQLVLLELSDLELECGLGISHPMHRKKLRLAIEEHRHPSLVRYPCIAQLGHTWVSSEWLPDLGLAQYSDSFAANMVDAFFLAVVELRYWNHLQLVLLELSDLELECGLGISHPMHRKKLRLAIEEHRHPSLVRYPCIAQLGHTWVSSEWLPDLGLAQYSDSFAANMVDAFFLAVVELRYWNHLQLVLLELSDLELECGLGISHPMHRKKLRLAIEEHRHPSLVRYPCIAQLGHTWVSSEWLPDLGLAQYSDSFAANMVDARMLEHLSKKELEKYLGVTRKFHQASVVHGIHLLRIMRYDRQALAVRRHQCETIDADPLVWSNQRFIRWARSIDLAEYADNLRDSGVHGGLVVLEPSFNGDTMATALGIPPGKNIVRRHLAAELEALVLPARSTLGHVLRPKLPPQPPANHVDSAQRAGLRGSLSRALGLSRSRDKHSPTSSSETSSVVSRVSMSGAESPVYATPYSFRYSYTGSGSVADAASVASSSDYHAAKDFLDNIVLEDGLRKHRRVRSIGDIDVIPIAPV